MGEFRNENQVNHPRHYAEHPSGVECIEVNENMDYCVGNAYKYLFRNESKHADPFLDLEKCLWYIRKEIEGRNSKPPMEKTTALAVKISDSSPKYQGDALFELWLATMDKEDVKHLEKAKEIVQDELSRRANRIGAPGPDR